MSDYGERGIIDTLAAFKKVGLDTVGAGKNLREASTISYKMVNGLRIATIGISDILPKDFGAKRTKAGVLPSSPSIFLPLVADAKATADIVLVHVHWGQEYDSRSHLRQRELGHALVEAGADVVIGHHPHTLEPIEVYKDSIILYSLGNFGFDQG
jgi:poly-gamma-glutamate synthesis protein (capsule biosynthesis protein)